MADVDDQEVLRIIQLELLRAPGQTIVEKANNAFRVLQARRRDGAHATDVNLAAAEHYMFNRQLAGFTGDPLTRLYPAAYFIKKVGFFAVGQETALGTDPRYPMLPPSLGSVAMASKIMRD